MLTSPSWDIIIIGAGAAGLFAACRAASLGKAVLLLEKNPQAGVKILMSGGTRCNLTQNTDNRGIIAAYGTQGKFLHSPLAALDVSATLDFFHASGVPTKVEDTNKIFPVSDSARDVRDALVARATAAGASIAYQEPVLELQKFTDSSQVHATSLPPGLPRLIDSTPRPPRFTITTPKRTLAAHSVILTTGGLSFPGSGTTGDGYRWAASLGHTLVPTHPALVPLTTSLPWVRNLRGITLPRVGLAIVENGKKLAATRGSLLFAHFGLTGPAALDVSRVVSAHARPSQLSAELDMLPDASPAEWEEEFTRRLAQAGKKQIMQLLPAELPRRIQEVILQLAAIPPDKKGAEISRSERQSLTKLVKQLPIPLNGTLGYGKAEVTAGGVPLNEVDSRTMQSKLVPGLYFAGEILDLDGPIGGYNFQAAWSTGWLAGESA
ncbi:MAG: NAD(P)/FAD-dependent oxidoreductase [Pirellulales bacterium]|nr:NAD(P)/FAD-dependent oxidoreductase [Pirellulales bacterium]